LLDILRGQNMLSIVIPTYNEEKNIPMLYKELKSVLDKYQYEIIFVDDGSFDNTFNIIKSVAQKDKKVKLISFKRNYGKSAALSAGFENAKGDIIITLDADLQDDPKEIPRFIEKINQGYDLVSGWKFKRKDSLTKIISSRFFNFLTSMLTKVKIHDINCGFKAYKKEVVKNINIYGELHRYIPVLAFWKGYKIGEIKVEHHPRMYGKSKYGATRLFKGFLDLITVKFLMSYGKRPLHLFGLIGLLCFLLGVILGIYLTYLWFIGKGIGSRPLLMLAVLLVVLGVQFVSLGLLGEMVTSTSKKKDYTIKEIVNLNKQE
jgi:glycosyltransferase involved in cell wall biosynthesis